MDLNVTELKYISRIKRNQKNNARLRWMKLLCALFMAAVGFSALRLTVDASVKYLMNDNKLGALAVAMAYPICLFHLGLAGFITTQTIFTWNGDIAKNLLVRLVEQSENINTHTPGRISEEKNDM